MLIQPIISPSPPSQITVVSTLVHTPILFVFCHVLVLLFFYYLLIVCVISFICACLHLHHAHCSQASKATYSPLVKQPHKYELQDLTPTFLKRSKLFALEVISWRLFKSPSTLYTRVSKSISSFTFEYHPCVESVNQPRPHTSINT